MDWFEAFPPHIFPPPRPNDGPGSAQPARRPPDRPRPGGLRDRPGGALQRRDEPEKHDPTPLCTHEDEETTRLLLQAA